MVSGDNKILRVNLTEGTVVEEAIAPQVNRDFIGGRGLGIYYLLNEVAPHCDPLGADNKLIMAVGPLTGTAAPTGSRYMIMTKSPLTGAVTCSNSGGYFPAEMAKAGFKAVLFEGVSPEPVYLWIDRGRAEIRSAAGVWGKNTHDTEDAIRAATDPKARVSCIGPGGEKLVRFAAVMNEKDRAAGRSGVGAVMGSKKLKAVAIRGDGEVALANKEAFRRINKELRKRWKENTKDNPPPIKTHGTAYALGVLQSYGALPTNNFQHGIFAGWEALHGETLTEKYLVRNEACFSCPLGCGRRTKVNDPPYEGEGGGPEYETLFALGSNCGVDNLAAVIKAGYLCNELGLDTISMGVTISCAMELQQRGWLSETEAGGPLAFGDPDAVIDLIQATAFREGFGDILAEGSLRMAERYGHPEIAMVSKGQELPGYEVRGAQGQGLGFATSPIGASHMRCQAAYFEFFGVPFNLDRHSWKEKPRIIKNWQDIFTVIDSAGLCLLFSMRNLVNPDLEASPRGVLDFLNAATGSDYTLEELLTAGERIFNAERIFLVREGFTRKDDSLPQRMIHEPLTDGPSKGMVCHLDDMLEEYYKLRGWNQDGIPTGEKIRALNLSWSSNED